ncbi:MAG: hypothetical protein M3063_16760 [Actinomycetota bacterium]|nr:hypothetical protein [Actinomycetota bacterium]
MTPVADYQPGERLAGVPGEAFVTPAPTRLLRPEDTVILHVLRPLEPESFRRVRPTLEAFAAIRSPFVGGLIEAGYQANEDPPYGWYVTADHGHADMTGELDRVGVLRAVAGAARGVHALHEAGLAHGGVSPVAIRPGPEGGVIDLPSVPAEPDGDGRILAISDPALLDTVDPAVARGSRPSRASDLWSLGATLHRALTGRLLHPDLPGDEPIVALQRVAFEPARVAEDLDPALADIVAWCVAAAPAQRPPSAAVLADQLDSVAGRR